jgi:hypothetical protein
MLDLLFDFEEVRVTSKRPGSRERFAAEMSGRTKQKVVVSEFRAGQRPLGIAHARYQLFHLRDPEATTLGQIVISLGCCKPAFGVNTFNAESPPFAWNSIYLARPDLPGPLLRGLARFAGVHLYSEDCDVLYGTPDLLSVHSVSDGPRTFRLPKPVEIIYVLFAEKVLAANASEFSIELRPASTALHITGQASPLGPVTSL